MHPKASARWVLSTGITIQQPTVERSLNKLGNRILKELKNDFSLFISFKKDHFCPL
jgi:hypothetical protein